MLEEGLRKYGEFIGKHTMWTFIVSLCLVAQTLVGWARVGTSYGIMDDTPFEMQWSTSGTKQAEEIQFAYSTWTSKERWNWEQQYVTTMIIPKEGKEGTDLATRQQVRDMESLFAKWFDISVTSSSGIRFTSWDLCARSAIPDGYGVPVFPCLVISIFDCFHEYASYLHPSYRPWDDNTSSSGDPTMKSYVLRPSYRNMSSDAELKEVVQAGCHWWTNTAMWPVDMTLGMPKLDNGSLVFADAADILIYYEGPSRGAWRLMDVHTNFTITELEKEFREAQEMHVAAWEKIVFDWTETSEDLEGCMIRPEVAVLNQLENDLEEPPWIHIFAGAVLLFLLMFLLADCKNPLQSRFFVATQGMQIVTLSLLASFGLMLRFGMSFSGPMISGLPFVTIGLGLDDMFVLSRALTEIDLQTVKDQDRHVVIGMILGKAGTGVVLTSVCNSVAFGLGAIIPVPAMSSFCTGACICAVMNFLLMLTLFMCVLVFEVLRIKANLPEPSCPCCQVGLCCCCCPSWCPCAAAEQLPDGPAKGLEVRFVQGVQERYAPLLVKKPVNVGMAFLVLVLLALSAISISNKDVGYYPHWLAAKGTPLNRGLEVYFEKFTYFSSYLIFANVDVPERQQDMLEFYETVASRPFTMPGFLPPYLQMLHWHMQAQGYENLTAGQRFKDGLEDKDEWYRKYHEWASWPANASAGIARVFAGETTYILSDLTRVNEFNYAAASEPSLARLQMSYAPFLVARLAKPSDFVDCVQDMRKLVDNSMFEGRAFAYGSIFTYWESFIALEGALYKVFLIDLGVIFISSLICLKSAAAAFITTIMCLAIVVEVYGICMQALPFNIFMATVLLACAGIAVEDVAHSIAHFIASEGSVERRLGESMSATFPAIIQGSVSTMLSILPMAFHPVPFYLIYYFFPFLMICVVGLFNGLICTPAFLAMMGWLFEICNKTSDVSV